MFKVLVAEDEIWVRSTIVEMIEKLSPQFSVAGEAGNGEKAWDFIQENWPTILITDIMMPRQNGLWLAEQIYEQNLPMVTIIISGYDNFQYAKQAMRFGITEYLLKPVNEEELHQALHHSIKRLEGMAEMRESIIRIQEFIEKLPDTDVRASQKQTEDLLVHILRLKSTNPLSCQSLLGILSNKLNELLLSIDPHFERISLSDHEEKGIRKYFLSLIESWNLLYPQYANQNVIMAIKRTCDYLEEHYADDISLSDAAQRAHLSISYFSGLFKKSTGQSFINYLSQLRIEKAKLLLNDPELKIYEVADQVGYTSIPNFNRVFKQIAGMPPQEYRKKLGL